MRKFSFFFGILLAFSCSKDCVPLYSPLDQAKEVHFSDALFKGLDFDFAPVQIVRDRNNTIYVVGHENNDSRDIRFLKLDDAFKIINGTRIKGNFIFSSLGLIMNSKNQFVVLNCTNPSYNGEDYRKIIIDSTGKIISEIHLERLDFFGRANSFLETPNGDLIILSTGYASPKAIFQQNIMLTRLNASGKIVWNKIFNEPDLVGSKIKLTNSKDGIYLVAESDKYYVAHEFRFKILNLDGVPSVEKSYLNPVYGTILPNIDILQTNEGQFITVYNTSIEDCALSNFFISYIDDKGIEIWIKRYGLVKRQVSIKQILQTKDGSFVILFSIYNGQSDIALIKINASGDITWFKSYGRKSLSEQAIAMVEKSNGNLVILGASNSKESDSHFQAIFLETNTEGNPQ